MKILVPVLFMSLNISFGYSQTKDSTESGKVVLPWFVERFKLSAGAFYVINKTNIQVELKNTTGTEIEVEKDLGIDREITTFLANFQWQISRRSRIAMNYFNVKRSSDHVLEKDIVFEDNTYYAGSTAQSFFNTKIFQFTYGYAILSKPKYEAGLFIGTHIVNGNTGISLDGSTAGVATHNDFGYTAPLPDLGIWGGWAVSNRFAINAEISYFAMTINNITGRLLAFNFNVTYKIIRQLDVSLGFTGLDFKVDIVRKDVIGNFKWGYNGPALAVNFSFGKKSWTH